MRVATATCVHFFSRKLMMCILHTLYICKSLSVSLTSVIYFIMYYVFNLRNILDQPLTPNFQSCLTSTCIVLRNDIVSQKLPALIWMSRHYNPCDKSIHCPSPHSKITYVELKAPPPLSHLATSFNCRLI